MDHELPSALQFRPPIWWDPAPDWIWKRLEDVFDQRTLIELVAIQLESQVEVMKVQMAALEKTAGLLRQGIR